MGTRPIGPVDTIWLHMDRPNNLMVIDTLVFLDGPADWDRLLGVMVERMVDVYPVFRQRPVMPHAHVGLPHWEDDPDFDLERHLVRVTLPGSDDRALQEYVESQIPVSLDREHPLWQLHLVDGFAEGSVVFCRLHHALADGIALTRVLLSLTEETPDGDPDDRPEPPEQPVQVVRDDLDGLGLVDGARLLVKAAGSATAALAGAATHLALDLPRIVTPHLAGQVLTQTRRTGAIVNKLVLGPRPESPFSGTPGVAKRAVWSGRFPLADVKHVGRLCEATVNDVLLASVAGALRTYVAEHGGEAEDLGTMVPVNVRDLEAPLPNELGNQFALVLFKYPTGVHGALARIAETKRRMDVIKDSAEVMLTFTLIKAIGGTGPEVERFLVDFFAGKAIGVTTNVPGPGEPRYLGGSRITGLLGWVPGSGEQTVGVSVFTYDGSIRVGFKVDAGLVPDPERLVAAFDEEMAELTRLAHAV